MRCVCDDLTTSRRGEIFDGEIELVNIKGETAGE